MIIDDKTRCGSCVNDPNDCSNEVCEACSVNMTHVDNGKCCGECIAKPVVIE